MDPRNLIQSSRDAILMRRELAKEAQRIKDEEGKGDLERQREMMAFWTEHRPKMVRRLGPQALEDLAVVLTYRMHEAVDANLEAGMYATDAREQAERDWLLMEPESPEDQE